MYTNAGHPKPTEPFRVCEEYCSLVWYIPIQDIPSLSSQSEHAKKHYLTVWFILIWHILFFSYSELYFVCRYYCAGDTNPEPTGPCSAGHFCTGKSSNPDQHITPTGHFSGEGASFAKKCPVGTFQGVRLHISNSDFILDCRVHLSLSLSLPPSLPPSLKLKLRKRGL